jgi:hypothetical protein
MSAPHRLPRTAVLSAVVLLLASLAHAAGGGELPASGDLLLASGPLLLASWFATRRRLAPAPLVGFVVGAQWLLHGAFGALAHGAGAVPHAQHAVATDVVATAQVTHSLSTSMVAAHTVAAVLVALWLGAGERLLWMLVESLVLRPLALLRAAVSPLSVRELLPCCAPRLDPVVGRVLAANVSWRGPPAVAGTA